MAASELDLEPDDVFLARIDAIRAKAEAKEAAAAEAAKPKLMVSIPPPMAEAIKANPTTLRVSARATDEVTVVDRPRRTEVIEVLEVVDARPSRVRRLDCVTGEVSVEDWVGGYRQPAGAISNYSPLDGLRTRDDE
jgi:hypothetical protein